MLEMSAALLTAMLHFIFYEVLPGQGPFIVVTVLAWSTYVAIRIRREPESLREFGLSTYGLRQSSAAASAVLVVGVALCVTVGLSRGGVRFVPHMVLLALLYPLWGVLQQLLVQGMVVRNLVPVLSTPMVVTIAAILFGVVHLPHVVLVLSTATLGAVFTLIFLRWPNVWALGICHGWLGVLFYYWVLGRDPWLEIVTGA
jgi:hypothetical protein